jgi:hypothetical protein
MLRFITIEVFAFHTSSTGMPAIGLPGLPGGRVHDVVRADHHGDVGVREVLVDLVHLEDDVVGHLGLGEQHVHVPGHAARDRVDREAHVDALLAQQLGDLVDRVLRLRDRHAVARHDDDALRLAQQLGRLGAADRRDLALPAAAPPAAAGAPPPVPKPPAITLMKLRFIARHMM